MAKRPPASAASPAVESLGLRLWTIAFGAFLGLALLKFPNPGVMDRLVSPPTNGWEWALMNWPLRYAWPLLVALVVGAIPFIRRPSQIPWPIWLPLFWVAWAGLSVVTATGDSWSGLTLGQHAAGVACFYIGWLVAGRVQNAGLFLTGVMVAVIFVLIAGWEQHFGGLAASRAYFYLYTYPKLTVVEPDMLKRIESSRIFATLFYPNSLAGALLLWLPALLGWVADVRHTFTAGAKWLMGGLLGAGAVACLVWSGSKTGWLLALGMVGFVLLRLPIRRPLKVGLVVLALLLGGAGFTARYLGFFQRGATSVVARMDYYRAGTQMVAERPLVGTGPGTFGVNYRRLKPPEAEMAQLAHNDYLQQAADSG